MSLGSRPTATVVEEFHTIKTTAFCIIVVNITPINFLQVPLRSSCTDLHTYGSLEAIRDYTRLHALLKGSTPQLTRLHTPLHIWVVLPRAPTRRVFRSRSSTLLLASFCHVSTSCVSHWRHHWLLQVDHWLSVGLTVDV